MGELKAERMGALQANYLAILSQTIADLEKKGKEVIRLDIGSPDLPPPETAVDDLKEWIEKPGCHGYQSHRGSPSLRQAWVEHYQRQYGVNLDPDAQVLPLHGSKEGIFQLALALVQAGDIILVPDPGYQTYAAGTRFCGGVARAVKCFSGNDFLQELVNQPDTVLREAKMMWVNFPHNPTGATVELSQLREIVALAREYEILLCHDAAYTRVTFGNYRAPSVLEVQGAEEVCVEFNSLSKLCNMAGWRMGVMVGNRAVIDMLYRLKTHADSGQFYPMMKAGAAGLTGNQQWIRERNQRYQKRRDLVLEALNSMGISVDPPRGGMYIWFPVPGDLPSWECVRVLVEEAQVALTPGIVFGNHGEGFLRLSLTAPLEQMREGMERVALGFSRML